jgi:hypothetical protein
MPPSGVVSSEAAARAAPERVVARALAPERVVARALALERARARCVLVHVHSIFIVVSAIEFLAGILFCENGANLTHHLPFTLVLQPCVHSYLRCRAAPAPPPERVAPREAPAPAPPPVRVDPERVAPREAPAPAPPPVRVVPARVAPREAPPAATLRNIVFAPPPAYTYRIPRQPRVKRTCTCIMSAVPVVSALHLLTVLPSCLELCINSSFCIRAE